MSNLENQMSNILNLPTRNNVVEIVDNLNTTKKEEIKESQKIILECKNLIVSYGNKQAIKNVSFKIPSNSVTAIIGPSGCGKSTLLRCFNRMNDLMDAHIDNEILFKQVNIYSDDINVVEIRRIVGMVFQKPNPFPTSIYNNVAFGLKVNGFKDSIPERVEWALREAVLWDEVKNRLHDSAYSLSGGQQQRLCIARALAVKPEILLMDEPTASLDPIASAKIEQLIMRLKEKWTIIIVTHNIQQAVRISDYVGVMMIDNEMIGKLIEFGSAKQIFEDPKSTITEDYIKGRFG